jgi:hypothetical protein
MGLFSLQNLWRCVRADKAIQAGRGEEAACLWLSALESAGAEIANHNESARPQKIDYLKIDVEGAEHGLIQDMLFSGIEPDQVAVEFDMPVPPWIVEKTIRALLLVGYELVEIWSLNCLFVKKSLLAANS